MKVLIILMGLPLVAPGASVLLHETFMGTQAPDWTLTNSAQLTAATGIDAVGSGFLRLTSAQNNQVGFAFNNTSVPFGYGLDIQFRYSIWGGTGADGLALVLFDGSTTPAKGGAYGGSLGYAQRTGVAGLAGGILGIGLDEWGNFANPTEGRQGGVGFVKNTVTIRGPGDGTANSKNIFDQFNYAYLTSSGALPSNYLQVSSAGGVRPNSDDKYREARIIVDTSQIPHGHLPVTVILKIGKNGQPQTVINNFDAYQQVLAYYGNDPTRIPRNLKFGFTGSTGGSTNNHEIQGLRILSVENAPGYQSVTPEPPSVQQSLLAGTLLIGSYFIRRRGARS